MQDLKLNPEAQEFVPPPPLAPWAAGAGYGGFVGSGAAYLLVRGDLGSRGFGGRAEPRAGRGGCAWLADTFPHSPFAVQHNGGPPVLMPPPPPPGSGRRPDGRIRAAAGRKKTAIQRALQESGHVQRTVYICDVDQQAREGGKEGGGGTCRGGCAPHPLSPPAPSPPHNHPSNPEIIIQVTEAELAVAFQACGPVVDCRVCGDPNSAMRFAFVEFRDDASARAALDMNGTVLGAYPVRIMPSKTAIVPVNRQALGGGGG